MDAPFFELVVRAGIAILATITALFVARSWRAAGTYSARTLVAYLAIVVGINAAWRWYVLWVGFQHDSDGRYSIDVEPYIRSMGNALLALLYVGILLIAWFHARRLQA